MIILSVLIGLGIWLYASQPPAPDFRMALIIPGDVDTPGWSSYVLSSAGVIEREFLNRGQVAEVAYVYQATPPEAELALELFAGQGYDFIVAADDAYIDAARQMADLYPATAFAVIGDEPGNGRNLGALYLRHDEPGYVAGQVMAYRTASGQVLYLADEKIPRRTLALQGIKAGLKSVDPAVQLQVIWEVEGPEKAQAIAEQAFDEAGVDVINIDAGIHTMMAVYEVSRQRPGTYVSNWQLDLSPLYPDHTLGSYNATLADVLTRAAVWVDEGQWPGRRYSLGVGDNAFNMTPIHHLNKDDYEAVRAAWAEIYDKGFGE